MGVNITLSPYDLELIHLSLARLSVERPTWHDSLRMVAARCHGVGAFDSFRVLGQVGPDVNRPDLQPPGPS